MPDSGSNINMPRPDVPTPALRLVQHLAVSAGTWLLCGAAAAFQIVNRPGF